MAVNDIFANTRVNIGDLLNTLAAQGNEQRSRATLQTGQDARQSMMDMVRQRQLREQMAMEVQEAQKARNAAMMQQSANSVLQALLQRGQQKAEAERQAAELGLRERLAGEAQTAETARSTARDTAELEAARIRAAASGGGGGRMLSDEDRARGAAQLGITEQEFSELWYGRGKPVKEPGEFQKMLAVRFGEFDDQIAMLSKANTEDPITAVWRYKIGVMAPALAQWRAAALSRGDAEVIATIDAYYDAQGIPNPAMQGGEISAPAVQPQVSQGVPAVRAEAPWMSAIRRFAPQFSRQPVASPQAIAAQVATQPPAVSQPAVAPQWPATGQWPIPVPPAQPVMAPATQQSLVNALLSSADPLAGMAVQPKERYADESSWWDLINPLAGYEVKEKK